MLDHDEEKPEENQAHVNAIAALTLFAGKYSPATLADADTFYTTKEISEAIEEHTGVYLKSSEIYELMSKMQYTYEELNGLQFRWLLRRE